MAIVLSRGDLVGVGGGGGLRVLTRDGRIEPVGGGAPETRSVPLGSIPRRPPGPQMFPAAAPDPPPDPDPMAALAELDPVQRAALLKVLELYIAGYCGPYHAHNRRSA